MQKVFNPEASQKRLSTAMVDPSLLTFFDGTFDSSFEREFNEHIADGRCPANSGRQSPKSNAFTSCTLLRMQALAGYGEGRKSYSPRFFLCTLRFELQEAE